MLSILLLLECPKCMETVNIGTTIPDMTGHQLTLMRCSVHQYPLNKVISILIPRNCMKLSIQPL